MFLLNRMKQGLFLVVTLLTLTVTQIYAAGEPSCGCDLLDPNSMAYDDCVSNCTGVDVPVNGNVWVLLLAGAGLFIARQRFIKSAE